MRVFPERLKAARKMAQLSQEKLGKMINVEKQTISNYEQGLRFPSEEVLLRIADICGVNFNYFFHEPVRSEFTLVNNIDYRKDFSFQAEQEERLIDKSNDLFNKNLQLLSLLDENLKFVNPIKNFQIESEDQVEEAAEKVRSYWKIDNNPIPNVAKLLENNDILVLEVNEDDGFDGFASKANNFHIIVINYKPHHVERMRLTLLHELGHLILSFSPYIMKMTIEKFCNRFANAMLVPKKAFIESFGGKRNSISEYELVSIKEEYGISIPAIVVRAFKLNLISKHYYYNLWNRIKELGWDTGLGQEPGSFPSKEKPNRFSSLILKAIKENQITEAKAKSLLGKDLKVLQKELGVSNFL